MRRLNELGVLARLATVSGVSGGSIVANLLADPRLEFPPGGGVVGGFEDFVAEPLARLTSRNIRTPALLAKVRPWNWAARDAAIRALADELADAVTWWSKPLRDNVGAGPAVVTCATEIGYGVDWVFEDPTAHRPHGRVGDYRLGYAAPPADLRLADVVAASCAFPPFFAPMVLDGVAMHLTGGKKGLESDDERAAILRRVRLTDGGVYDNLGLEPVWKRHATVLVSDGGGVFRARTERTVVGRTLRILGIATNGGQSVRSRWLHAGYARGVLHGTSWALDTVVDGSYPRGTTELVNAVRTDLDVFSQPGATRPRAPRLPHRRRPGQGTLPRAGHRGRPGGPTPRRRRRPRGGDGRARRLRQAPAARSVLTSDVPMLDVPFPRRPRPPPRAPSWTPSRRSSSAATCSSSPVRASPPTRASPTTGARTAPVGSRPCSTPSSSGRRRRASATGPAATSGGSGSTWPSRTPGTRRWPASSAAGWSDPVITQNVDGLHQQAGATDVEELHGSLARVVCLTCGDRSSRWDLDDRMREANPTFTVTSDEIRPDGDIVLNELDVDAFRTPLCLVCGHDTLKPDVVFFGESVPKPLVEKCFRLTEEASALVVLGSSLKVMSGYRFVRRAAALDIPVVIITRGPTRGDEQASVQVDAPLGPTLAALLDRVAA